MASTSNEDEYNNIEEGLAASASTQSPATNVDGAGNVELMEDCNEPPLPPTEAAAEALITDADDGSDAEKLPGKVEQIGEDDIVDQSAEESHLEDKSILSDVSKEIECVAEIGPPTPFNIAEFDDDAVARKTNAQTTSTHDAR